MFRVLPDAPRLPLLAESSNRSYESPYHHDSLKRTMPHQHSRRGQHHGQVSTDSRHSKRRLHHKNGAETVSENGHAHTDSDFPSDSDSKLSAAKSCHNTKNAQHRATDGKASRRRKHERSDSESGMSESTTRRGKQLKSRSTPKSRSSRKRRLGVVATKSDSESSEASVTVVPRNSLRRKSVTSQESEESRPKKMYRVKKSM